MRVTGENANNDILMAIPDADQIIMATIIAIYANQFFISSAKIRLFLLMSKKMLIFACEMSKINWKPGTMIYPLPAVMVSCGASEDEYNILTISWVGTICTNPAMCYISVRPERHSYPIIGRTREFVINLTTEDLARATDWCGVRSGKEHNKFTEMGLTPVRGVKVSAPIIAESPLNIECRVIDIKPLGSHTMFIAEVVNVQADEQYIDPVSGKFDLERAHLLSYSHGQYYSLGRKLGKFGWSVEKKVNKKRKKTIKQ